MKEGSTWSVAKQRRVGTATSYGSGNVSGMSGALDKLPVTFKSRIGSPDGRTSPEELIAAAHSSCFSMALANLLTDEGHPPADLEVTADVTLDDSLRRSDDHRVGAEGHRQGRGAGCCSVTRGRGSRRCRVPGLAGARLGPHHRAGDDRVGIAHVPSSSVDNFHDASGHFRCGAGTPGKVSDALRVHTLEANSRQGTRHHP